MRFWEKPVFRQCQLTLSFASVLFASGMASGTPTIMVPQLKRIDSAIQIDDVLAVWLYSVHGLGAIVGLLTVTVVKNHYGTRTAVLINSLPVLIGFIIQCFAMTGLVILVSEIMQGVSIGGGATCTILAMSEYAIPKYRGLILTVKSASYFWGIWISQAIGTFVDWRWNAYLAIAPIIFSSVLLYPCPESPIWLASKGRFKECKAACYWLRGNSEETKAEIAALISGHKEIINNSVVTEKSNFVKRFRKVVTSRHFFMPFVLSFVIFTLHLFCGKMFCAIYALVIIKELTKNETTAYVGMLIADGVSVLGMYLGGFLALKLKRRTLFFGATISAIVLLYCLSLYLFLIQFEVIRQNPIIILFLIALYSFFVCSGPMVLCTTFFCEIVPTRYKYVITVVITFYYFVMLVVILKSIPLMIGNIGLHGTFLVFAISSTCAIIFLWKFLPETKDRTLLDIEMQFMKTQEDYNNICQKELMLSKDREKVEEKVSLNENIN